jgi:hypothetical protein
MPSSGNLWTLDRVNLVLPLVASVARDVIKDFARLRRAGRAARALAERHGLSVDMDADKALAAARSFGDPRLVALRLRITDAAERIEAAVPELCALVGEGVELRDYSTGVFDFATVDGGEPGYWTWCPADGPACRFWHRADQGWAQRVERQASPMAVPAGPPRTSTGP